MDSLQFAYQDKISVEDAILFMLQKCMRAQKVQLVLTRCCFDFFSSAFNTIQHRLLCSKLKDMLFPSPMMN